MIQHENNLKYLIVVFYRIKIKSPSYLDLLYREININDFYSNLFIYILNITHLQRRHDSVKITEQNLWQILKHLTFGEEPCMYRKISCLYTSEFLIFGPLTPVI